MSLQLINFPSVSANCLTHKKIPLKATFLDRQLVQVELRTKRETDHLVPTMEYTQRAEP